MRKLNPVYDVDGVFVDSHPIMVEGERIIHNNPAITSDISRQYLRGSKCPIEMPVWDDEKQKLFRQVTETPYSSLLCEDEMCTIVDDIHCQRKPAHFITANTDEYVIDLLERSLPKEKIGTVFGNRTLKSKAEKLHMLGLDAKDIVWITDTSSDVEYGLKAGVGMIIGTAFPWSVHGRSILLEDHPELIVVDTPQELHAILKEVVH